ncbi:MAG: glycosyltransferase family 4 protein [Actinomycetota bacterium]
MKICFVYEYYHPHVGGGEMLMQLLAEGLVRRGHQASVVTAQLPGTKKEENINGVEVYRVPVPAIGDRYWFTIFSLRKVMEVGARADIIHTATYNGAISSWIVARIKKKPTVIITHEVLNRLWFRVGINPLAAAGFFLFEKVVLMLPFDSYSCNSQSTMKALTSAGIAGDKAFLAYPGIDYDLFSPANGEQRNKTREEIRRQLGIDEDTFLYLYTGRPGVLKGVEFLIRAVPEIRQKIPGARLLLLLSKKPRSKYKEVTQLVKSLAPADILLHSQVERHELPLYFQAADCIVVPSLNEGFGFTCVEACTSGTPVVATRAGSLPEVVSGDHVLVRPGDAAALAEGVERVYQGRCDYTEPRRFTWDACVDIHLEAYAHLIETRV